MMQVVLVEPEIPQNTGSIARTCAATEVSLHLVGKLGFDISDKAVRRAGLDYWPWVDLHTHRNWDQYLIDAAPERLWFFSAHGTCSYFDVQYGPHDTLVFGSETKGLGKEFLAQHADSVLTIPIKSQHVRSLNLSNVVTTALYEAIRQIR